MPHNIVQIFYGDINDSNRDVIKTKTLVDKNISEALDMALPSPELFESAYVFMNAHYIPSGDWESTRIKRGDVISICFTPDAFHQLMFKITPPQKRKSFAIA